MGRREDNRERTRQRLSDASFELFRTRGFEESRVQDIVALAGVSPATFFNYFPSKLAVLEARAAESAQLYAALIRHELERVDESVASRLEQIVTVLAAYLELDLEAARLLSARTSLFLSTDGDELEHIRVAQRGLIELVEQGQASGELDRGADAEQLVELFSAVLTITTSNWLVAWWGPPEEPLGTRLVTAVRLLLDGMRSRPAPTDRSTKRRSPSSQA